MGSRTWIKLYVDKWLEGSLRQEKPALRGVWADLLALCGGGQYSQDGEIKIKNGVGFPDKVLAKVLNITPNMWTICKKRLIETERLSVNSSNILTIINWKNYQSEYERQKPQRTKSAGKSAGIEVDVRLKTIDDRSREKNSPATSSIAYKEKLRTTFPELDIDAEWERCQIWYRDHKKAIKSPSLALGNWCGKEREIRKESGRHTGQQDLISGQSIEKAIKIARGELAGNKRNTRFCQEELDRRGIEWRDTR